MELAIVSSAFKQLYEIGPLLYIFKVQTPCDKDAEPHNEYTLHFINVLNKHGCSGKVATIDCLVAVATTVSQLLGKSCRHDYHK